MFRRLIWSRSIIEIGLGLIFTDFVSAFMLRLCRINTGLHISENTAIFGICNKHTGVIRKQWSKDALLMYLL
jgi:hypothetical protein